MVVELDGDGAGAREEAPRRPLTRRQKYTAAALALALVTLLVARHALTRPAQAANSPPPPPSLVAAFSYLGPVHDAVPGGNRFTLAVRATATGDPPFQLVSAQQDYPGILTNVIDPLLPQEVRQGAPVDFTVVYVVTDCAAAPRDAGMPFLDVTLRNTGAIQTLSQILGPGYARDLSRNLHLTCPDSGMRTSTPVSTVADTPVRYSDPPGITSASEPSGVPPHGTPSSISRPLRRE
ncbi:hypothetical protein CFP65_1724 [Kitasatospora sp. MMS16-BH015]|uniref:hypothetical protein n=1 Tax=Kitasatospora sp. MMS16-BH015 TaxID=2018025 RepID=UPI000CA2898C|nr:hypothetical protein [Kitasatospora sp. MMS16-BH015]AUG76603.1 hypothetical protein CFP65_1724 [Kitasatospora sp. MMS16-BH015]